MNWPIQGSSLNYWDSTSQEQTWTREQVPLTSPAAAEENEEEQVSLALPQAEGKPATVWLLWGGPKNEPRYMEGGDEREVGAVLVGVRGLVHRSV